MEEQVNSKFTAKFADQFRLLESDSEIVLYGIHSLMSSVPSKDDEFLWDLEFEDLLKKLEDIVYNHSSEWLWHLPMHELRILERLVRNEYVAAAQTFQYLFIEKIGLIDRTLDTDNHEFLMYDDIRQAISPYINNVIKQKEGSNYVLLENLLSGILNIVGTIHELDAQRILQEWLAKSQINIPIEEIDYFFDHSVLVRYTKVDKSSYGADPLNILCSLLYKQPIGYFEYAFYFNLDYYIPKNINEILAHSKYPYLEPYRPEEKELHKMLLNLGYDEESAYSLYTYYYARSQNPIYGTDAIMEDITKDYTIRTRMERQIIHSVINNFIMERPCFHLRGNKISEVCEMLKDVGIKTPEDVFTMAFRVHFLREMDEFEEPKKFRLI